MFLVQSPLTVYPQEGSRALREAFSLDPHNKDVADALATIQRDESLQPLLKLCRKFVAENDVSSGEEAIWYLNSGHASDVSSDIAAECVQSAIDATKIDEHLRDNLVSSLLQNCLGARVYLAKKLKESISVTFEQTFAIGDGAANGITAVSLDAAAWPKESERVDFERDVFLLFLAKLLESGDDFDGRAMKGISRHLAADANRLHVHVDEESFDAILCCLDYRLSREIRSSATISTAKYLEASKEVGEEYLRSFIQTRASKHSTEDLVKAFSTAAAVFPIVTPVVAPLFLKEGFLPSLVPMLDKKSRAIKVEKAALDMLSAACVDAGCREAIGKYCMDWMHHVMDDEEDERHGQAAVILAKVHGTPDSPEETKPRRRSKSIFDIVPTLKKMLLTGGDVDKRAAIEGLAYASRNPSVKDEITRDPDMLRELLHLPRKDSVSPTTAFGFLTLIDNLTRYLPTLSEEQKRMLELKAYANASKPALKPDPLEEDSSVGARCKWLLDSHIVAYLVTLKNVAASPPLSPASLHLLSNILLSLSRNPSSRGPLAQQGAVPTLLSIYNTVQSNQKATSAQAIARILISVDPTLLSSHVSSCIPPLISLLAPEDVSSIADGPRDLLPAFESLLALTNLASNPTSPGPATEIVRLAFSLLEDLLLSNNTMLRRAATELICNLCTTPAGIEQFADGSPAAGRRLHIILALSDVDDVATRRAAGGALAGITEFEAPIKQILERERGLEKLFNLCNDEDSGCVHRGVVCIRNIVCADNEAGILAHEQVMAENGTNVLKEVLMKSRDQEVLNVGVEALRALVATSETSSQQHQRLLPST